MSITYENMLSIGESFNARTTNTQELCNTFISNIYFERLCSPNNVIMIGPRGSGKTTLLRMLEVEALDLWDKEISNEFRRKIDFSGVFIPTDRFWKTQYDKLLTMVEDNNSLQKILESIFIYHILEKLASTITYRASKSVKRKNHFKHIEIDKETESAMVEDLSSLWQTDVRIKSLRGLTISIIEKKQELSDYISKATAKELSLPPLPRYIDSDLIRVLDTSIKTINIYLNCRDDKWAFLFDELELAPDKLIQPLIDAMRGGPDNIIFKLALSPYHKGVSITDAPTSTMKDQDLTFINLTGVNKKESENFAIELCSNLFVRNGLKNNIDSYFENPQKTNVELDFKELYDKDESFKNFIDKKSINIKNLSAHDDTTKAQIRKIQFIVQLRNYSLKYKGHRKSRRRPADYYAGFINICKAMEYNPRMLIGIMNTFIPIAKSEGIISISTQLSYLNNYYQSFQSLLSTIAIKSNNSAYNTIYDLIEVIAKAFHNEIYGPNFKPNPCGSINFKKGTHILSYKEAIGYALNAGALIAEKNDIGAFHDVINIEKTKCRLSFLFSHHFGLLMIKQKEKDLMSILNSTDEISVIEPFTSYTHQMELIL
ncbi:hypothetical protein ACEUBH_17530 [Aeromonas veronii]|uniref:ORC-CDC6 family AAA ATPase n=1 Tax=Aeromonas veronii TaxID=654 RepID=UPI0038D8FC49